LVANEIRAVERPGNVELRNPDRCRPAKPDDADSDGTAIGTAPTRAVDEASARPDGDGPGELTRRDASVFSLESLPASVPGSISSMVLVTRVPRAVEVRESDAGAGVCRAAAKAT
jgi:hypothetical protein